MSKLEEIEAIKQLKYKYLRCLDSKDWTGMAETFTADAKAAYDSGKYSFEGRDAIMAFLQESLATHRAISMHTGHHPEIEITGERTANGRWYLEDRVIFLEHDVELHGTGFYEDEYVKVGDEWKICKTGYERVFEQVTKREGVVNFRSRFDAPA